MRKVLLLLSLTALVLPASAQRRRDRMRYDAPVRAASAGFFVEGALNGIAFTVDPDDGESDEGTGGGLGVRLGYGFNRSVALYVALNGAAIEPEDEEAFQVIYGEDSYTLGQGDLGLQFSFARPRSQVVPYVNVALTGVSATIEGEDDDDDIEFSGGGVTLGGGVRYHFSPGLAFNAGLEGFAGTLSSVKVGGIETDFDALDVEEPEFSGGRLRLGLTWFLGTNRR